MSHSLESVVKVVDLKKEWMFDVHGLEDSVLIRCQTFPK